MLIDSLSYWLVVMDCLVKIHGATHQEAFGLVGLQQKEFMGFGECRRDIIVAILLTEPFYTAREMAVQLEKNIVARKRPDLSCSVSDYREIYAEICQLYGHNQEEFSNALRALLAPAS